MADLDPQTTETPAAPPAPEPSYEDAREQHAEEALGRALERAGAPPDPEPAPEADRPALTVSQPESRREPQQEPRQPPHLHPASLAYRQRVEAAGQRRLLERIDRAAQALEQGGMQPGQAQVQAAKQEDPEPKWHPDDPESIQAWYAWRERDRDRRLDERLAPVTGFIEQQQQQHEQQAAWQQQQQQVLEHNRHMAAELDFAAEAYAQTPEGRDFNLRFDWYVNDVLVAGWMRNGMDQQRATHFARIGAAALVQTALANSVNPALFIDNIIAAGVESTVRLLVDAGYQAPNGHQPAAPARRPAARQGQQEINSLRQTAASASSVTGGLARQINAGPKGAASGLAGVVADPTPENVRAFAAEEHGGDTRAAMRAIRRATAAALAQSA